MGRVKVGYDDFVHTGPGTLAGRFMRTFWQPIRVGRELARGRAVPVRILGEDFTLYRGENGTPHLLGFRCAHRGTQLSVGWVEGDCIRCFYHGWKYDGTGQCVEQPAEPKPFCDKIRVPSYPVKEYLGLIFAYLGEGAPPLLPRLPSFEDPDSLLEVWCRVQEYNYWNSMENALDFTHTAFVHQDYVDFDPYRSVPELSAEETPWGLALTIKLRDGRVKVNQFVMPTSDYVYAVPRDPEIGRMELILWKVPIDDERHLQFVARRVAVTGKARERYLERQQAQRAKMNTVPHEEIVQAVLSGKMTVTEIDQGRLDLIGLQDTIAQQGQGVIYRPAQERLGRSDVGMILLRKIWKRELQALAEGQPLTQWTVPPDMTPTKWELMAAVR